MDAGPAGSSAASPNHPRGGVRGLVVTIGSTVLVTLVVAAGAVALQDGRDPGRRPPVSAGANAPAPDRAAVAALLALQARAVRTHDKAAFLAVVDPARAAFLARQGELFDSLRRLPLTGWRQEADTGYPATAGPQGATLRLTL